MSDVTPRHRALIVIATLATGCAAPASPSPTASRDEGECVALTEAVRIGPTTTLPGTATLSPSVGLVDGHVLLQWAVYWPSEPDGSVRVFVQWLDSELAAQGDPVSLGNSPGSIRSRWVAVDGRLTAQVWANGDDAIEPGRSYTEVAIWTLEPPGGAADAPTARACAGTGGADARARRAGSDA